LATPNGLGVAIEPLGVARATPGGHWGWPSHPLPSLFSFFFFFVFLFCFFFFLLK
jgi:hypothetical protein